MLSVRALHAMLPLDSSENKADGRLLAVVYEELRRLAARQMDGAAARGQTLQPTALVHEAWLKLSGRPDSDWNDRTHYFRAAALAMRRILVDRARQKSALKRTLPANSAGFPATAAGLAAESDLLLRVDECLERMERDFPDGAKVIQMKFFAGLGNRETAEALGMSLRGVERLWAFAKARLRQMLQENQPGG